jgi:hypothetical protein
MRSSTVLYRRAEIVGPLRKATAMKAVIAALRSLPANPVASRSVPYWRVLRGP